MMPAQAKQIVYQEYRNAMEATSGDRNKAIALMVERGQTDHELLLAMSTYIADAIRRGTEND